MYSILILFDNGKWYYFKNMDDTQYIANTLQEVQAKVKELIRIYSLNEIKVVKNCTITEDITVAEDGNNNTENNEETPGYTEEETPGYTETSEPAPGPSEETGGYTEEEYTEPDPGPSPAPGPSGE